MNNLYLLFAALIALAIQVISAKKVNVCELPIKSGGPDIWCQAIFQRWGYDKETNKCQKFIYGGCEGNGNRFSTEADCQSKCGRSRYISVRQDWNPQHPFDILPEGGLFKRSPGLDWDWDPLHPFDIRPPGSKLEDWNYRPPYNKPDWEWDPQRPFNIPPEGRQFKRSPGLDWDWDPLYPFDIRPPGSKLEDWNYRPPYNKPDWEWDPQRPFNIPPEGRQFKRSPGLDWDWDPLHPFDIRPPGSKPDDWKYRHPFNFPQIGRSVKNYPRQDWDPQHPFDLPPEGQQFKRSPGLDWDWDPLHPFDIRPPGSKPEDWSNRHSFPQVGWYKKSTRQDWDPQRPFDFPPEGRLFKRSARFDWNWAPQKDWDPQNPFDIPPVGRLFKRSTRQDRDYKSLISYQKSESRR